MNRTPRRRIQRPAMASEPFLGEIIIFVFQLIRILLSFIGLAPAA